MTWQEIVTMFAMAIMLGQCKYIYVFLSAIYLWIPKERFAGMKRKIWYAVTLATATGMTMAIWLFATNVVKLGGSISQTAGTTDGSVNLFRVLAGTVSYNWKIFIASATADSLGDLDIHPSKLLVVLFALLFTFIHEGYVNEEFQAVIGIQGRYFIPMMAPVSMGITLTNSRLQCPQISGKWLNVCMAVMNLPVIYAVYTACCG